MRKLAIIMLLSSLLGLGVQADYTPEAATLDAFKQVPILFEGRKMPMDSFARHLLVQFSGRKTIDKQPAAQWLANLLFDPGSTMHQDLFLVNHPGVLQALELEPKEGRRYAYRELGPELGRLSELAQKAWEVEDKERSLVDNELIRVYQNVQAYMALFQSIQFDVPLPEFTPSVESARQLQLPEGQAMYSYLDVFRSVPIIQNLITNLKGLSPDEWSPFEKDVFSLSAGLYEWTQNNKNNPLVLIPFEGHGEESWLSPWEAILFMGEHRYLETEVRMLSAIRTAWVAGDESGVATNLARFSESTGFRTKDDREVSRAGLEVHYNEANWFTWSRLFYGFAFLFAFAGLFTNKRWIGVVAWLLLLAGFLPHTTGIVERMIIMARPPVTNLYATFLFVAWIVTFLCMALEVFQKNRLGLLTAGLSGFGLLMIAGRFAFEGDSMGKMVAVLNSNFWLSTHVVCITTGYAGCVAAGIIGHVYLLARLIDPKNFKRLMGIEHALYGVLGFGLTFSFFGTMLGGIWADQSWGRFWGWDPKENGALLIVIWCAVLFHARLGGFIREIGMAAGTALGVIVVMFAWLGVNLLGVGLHSYGFTSGLAVGLYSYMVIQLIVVFGLVLLVRRREKKVSHAG